MRVICMYTYICVATISSVLYSSVATPIRVLHL
jgi:hypothetical protein